MGNLKKKKKPTESHWNKTTLFYSWICIIGYGEIKLATYYQSRIREETVRRWEEMPEIWE